MCDKITKRIEQTGTKYGAVTWVHKNENPYGVTLRSLNRYWNKIAAAKEPAEVMREMVDERHDKRGTIRRVFTIEEEREMALLITRQFIDSDIPFVNETYELLALEFWRQRKQTTRRTQWKGPSVGYIVAFKKRWGFATKVPRLEHVAKNPNLQQQQEVFQKECKTWMDYVGPARFYNYDETFWRLLQNVLQAWGRRGQQLRSK